MLKRSDKTGAAPPQTATGARLRLLSNYLPSSVHAAVVALFFTFALVAQLLSFIVIAREKAFIARAHDAYVAGSELGRYLAGVLTGQAFGDAGLSVLVDRTGFIIARLPKSARRLQGGSKGQWRETPLSLSLGKVHESGSGVTLHLRVLSNGGAFSVARLPGRSGELAVADGTSPLFRFSSSLARLSQYLANSHYEQKLAVRYSGGWLLISHPVLWNNDRRVARYGWLFALGLLGLVFGTPVLLRKTLRPLAALADDAGSRKGHGEFEPLMFQGADETDLIAANINLLLEKNARQLETHSEFMAAISHDLATPVTRLRLRSRLIRNAELREKFLADCSQMSAMLKDALAYFRNEAVDEEMRLVRVHSLVESLCQDYQDAGRNVSFTKAPPFSFDTVPSLFHGESERQTVNFERSLTAFVRPNAVRRALQNLIDNALKFGGGAEVELNATSRMLSITIKDRGPGIPVNELEKVFRPFYRIDRARNMNVGGSGLGLAIVQAVVEAHGGTITLENNLPGLCATIGLPRGGAPVQDPE